MAMAASATKSTILPISLAPMLLTSFLSHFFSYFAYRC